MRALSSCILTGLVLVLGAATASAQTVDPRTAEFDPSPDHNALGPGGVPVVSGYDLEFYLVSGTVPVRVVPLGKPDPDPDGLIRVDFLALLSPPLPTGVTHVARVTAVGPGGLGRSTPSNTFLWGTACSTTIAPTGGSVPAAGGSGSFTVTAPAGCAWTAVNNNPAWISIAGGASGSGNGTVAFTASANANPSQRTGSITVDGSNFTISQAGTGTSCTYAVSPTSRSVAAGGGSSTFAVTAPAGCGWTAVSQAGWISITSGATGSGNGTVAFSATAHAGSAQRSGGITIAGRTVTVSQVACAYGVTPMTPTVSAAGGPLTITVTTSSGCTWTASESATWISITAGSSGSGNGTVTLQVSPRTQSSQRSTTVTVAGRGVSVTQSGASTTPPSTPKGLRVVPIP